MVIAETVQRRCAGRIWEMDLLVRWGWQWISVVGLAGEVESVAVAYTVEMKRILRSKQE